MSGHHEMAVELRHLTRSGFKVTVTGRSHFKITHPEILRPIFAGGTPSDRRAIHNLRAMIRRMAQRRRAVAEPAETEAAAAE
jgi:hypothetical protein